MSEPRVVAWYSDGAASAVAAKLAVEKYGERCEIVKCDTTPDEHPDNYRFRADVEGWIGRAVTLIRSTEYASVDDVIEKRRYISGVAGAPCTTHLKKMVRYAYQRPDDVHVFGYTRDEGHRIKRFKTENWELSCDWILVDQGVTKEDCYLRLRRAGIELPEMNRLGFDHNNCIACGKATSPAYWNRTRQLFPLTFDKRARQSREVGARLVRVDGVRMFLDELPEGAGQGESDGEIECGPFCELGTQETLDFDAA